MDEVREIVRGLDDVPAGSDPIWESLAQPVLSAITSAQGELDTKDLLRIGKRAGLPRMLTREALAWLSLNGSAGCVRGKWRARE